MDYPLCVECQNFAYWDGDFCCVGDDMRILVEGDKLTNLLLTDITVFPQPCSNYKHCKSKKLISLRKEVISDIIEENEDKNTETRS